MKNKFEEFRNNVFCRREYTQHKAEKLWKEISIHIDESDKSLFQTEWNHYMIGEIDYKDFSLFFDEYIKKYFV
jgi:hypothetical protein